MDHPPPVLRTGFAGDGATVKIDKRSPLGKRLLGLVFVLVKRAATSAALYCMHNGRHVVTPDDVRGALKYHAVSFFSEAGFEQLERDVESMEGLVDQFVTESLGSNDIVDTFADEAIDERDDDEDYVDDPEDVPEEDGTPSRDGDDDACDDTCDCQRAVPSAMFEATACECDVCRGIRELDWTAWQPTDPAELFIKTHIDELENSEE